MKLTNLLTQVTPKGGGDGKMNGWAYLSSGQYTSVLQSAGSG
jgi:hypothetical protein